jgi:hypothetical protein
VERRLKRALGFAAILDRLAIEKTIYVYVLLRLDYYWHYQTPTPLFYPHTKILSFLPYRIPEACPSGSLNKLEFQ